MTMCINRTIESPSVVKMYLDFNRDIVSVLYQNFKCKTLPDGRLTFQNGKWCRNRNQRTEHTVMFSLRKSTHDVAAWK